VKHGLDLLEKKLRKFELGKSRGELREERKREGVERGRNGKVKEGLGEVKGFRGNGTGLQMTPILKSERLQKVEVSNLLKSFEDF